MKKPRKLRLLLLFACGLLVSCTPPPDVLGCTGFPSPDYFKMRDLFFKICGDDPACKPNLPMWKAHFEAWTVPSEEGLCTTLISGKQTYVGKDSPYVDGSTWKDLNLKIIVLPAKQSVAPLLTYIETQCHNSKDCGNNVGNWQSTSKVISDQIK